MGAKQPKGPSTDECLKEMWYIRTIDYYSAFEKEEILQYVTVWINLEDLMLSEISQSQKDKYFMIPLI